MVVAIQKELGLPSKFIGLGERPDDSDAWLFDDATGMAETGAPLL